MFRLVKENRLARLAAIGIAVNVLGLIGPLSNYLRSRISLDLWVPAADVHPYLNPDTREVVQYEVANVDVATLATRAAWPKFGELCGAIGLNAVLWIWMLRLVAIGKTEGTLILAENGTREITDLDTLGSG